MVITQHTSATAGLSPYPEVAVAAKAGALAVNDSGGVGGRKLEVDVCDTKGLPNGGVQCAQRAVRDHVAAVVGTYDLYGTYLSVLEKAKIPSIAPFAIAKEYTSAMSFPIWGGARALIGGLVSALVSRGAKSVAFMSSQNPAAAATLETSLQPSRDHLPGVDIKVVSIPANTIDYSAVVASATRQRGIAVATFPNDAIATVTQLAKQGAKQPVVTSILSIDQAGLKQLGSKAEGLYAVTAFKPPSDTQDPAVAKFNTYMDKVDASVPKDDHAENAFAGMLLFANVAADINDPSGPAIVDALSKAGAIDVGLMPPIDFSKPITSYSGITRLFNMKVTYVQVKNGVYTALDNGRFFDAVTGA